MQNFERKRHCSLLAAVIGTAVKAQTTFIDIRGLANL